MPLIDAERPPTTNERHFVVYFASGEPSWCPDCRDALPALKAVFEADSAPTAYLVRVGERAEWKGVLDNPFRKPPFNIQGVPTVVRVENGKEVSRLGDDESQQESALREFAK